MSEMDDIVEERVRGTEISTAILHVLDGRNHHICLSERSLDLEDKNTEKYIKRYVNRCSRDMRVRPGTFNEGSDFEKETERYFQKETDLPSFSANVLRPLISYFEEEEARSFEVLIADYRIDDVPYLALILLEEQEVLTCVSGEEAGKIVNSISFANASLPSVSKSVSSFALINQISHEISYCDETKWKDGISVITEKLLDAEAGISKKEVIASVREIAYEAAEEFDETPAVVLGKVKSYITDTVNEGMALNTETLVQEMFEEKPEMAEFFMKKAEEVSLPKEVELPKASIQMSMKKQKIKTDTGIEISFPSEYSNSSEFIEFVKHDDGSFTIEIRKVGKIDTKI